MSYFYEEEKQFRRLIEKLIIFSDEIDNVYNLYEEMFGKVDIEATIKLVEEISVFFETVKQNYGYELLELDTETFIYRIDKHYKNDLINVTKVMETITADDFEKLSALFLKEIVNCESVNATLRSHDQGIDFVGYKRYIQSLTTQEQNQNLLYVIGQAKHYKSQYVETNEIRELAGSIYLLKANDFSKKRNNKGDKTIYSNLVIDAFTPIIPYFITSNYFSKYAYILCRNASIIAIDRLSLILNFVFSNKFKEKGQNDIIKTIQKIERIS